MVNSGIGHLKRKYFIPVPMCFRVFQHPIWRVFGIFLFIPFFLIDLVYLVAYAIERVVPIQEYDK